MQTRKSVEPLEAPLSANGRANKNDLSRVHHATQTNAHGYRFTSPVGDALTNYSSPGGRCSKVCLALLANYYQR
jgi:hypothetical protein